MNRNIIIFANCRISNSMFLRESNKCEVANIMQSLKNNKARGKYQLTSETLGTNNQIY